MRLRLPQTLSWLPGLLSHSPSCFLDPWESRTHDPRFCIFGLLEISAKYCTFRRMRIELFISFILLVENDIKKENTNFRQAVSSEELQDVWKMGLLILLISIYPYEYIALEQFYKLILSEDEVEFKKSENFWMIRK